MGKPIGAEGMALSMNGMEEKNRTAFRCLSCGKDEADFDLVKGHLCPKCRGPICLAQIPSDALKRRLRRRFNYSKPHTSLVQLLKKIGVGVVALEEEEISHLRQLCLPRVTDPVWHPVVHAHIQGREGYCVRDVTSRSNYRLALKKAKNSKASFVQEVSISSSGAVGKLLEQEFSFRSSKRPGVLKIASEQLQFTHPLAKAIINCEIDGRASGTPLEIKTISDFSKITFQKLIGILHQMAEQIMATGVAEATLMLVEREGASRVTVIRISGLKSWHLGYVKTWINDHGELDSIN